LASARSTSNPAPAAAALVAAATPLLSLFFSPAPGEARSAAIARAAGPEPRTNTSHSSHDVGDLSVVTDIAVFGVRVLLVAACVGATKATTVDGVKATTVAVAAAMRRLTNVIVAQKKRGPSTRERERGRERVRNGGHGGVTRCIIGHPPRQ